MLTGDFVKLVVVNNGVVKSIVTARVPKQMVGDSVVAVANDVPVKITDVYSGGVFSDNPKLADIQLAEQKKKEFLTNLQGAKSLEELKAAVAAADADINKDKK